MKLIVEDDRDVCGAHVLKESIDHNDGKYHPFMIVGCMAIAEKINKNNRRYPFPLLKKEFDRFIEEDVKTNHAWGLLEHPEKQLSESEEREQACIKICEVVCDEKNTCWNGKAQLCHSDEKFGIKGFPKADIAYSYYQFTNSDTDEHGSSIFGFSTRGYGDLEMSKINEERLKNVKVLTNFYLKGVDLVMNPSCNVYAEGILESKEFMMDTHGQIVECAYNKAEDILNASTKTFDLDTKRDMYRKAWDTLLKNI